MNVIIGMFAPLLGMLSPQYLEKIKSRLKSPDYNCENLVTGYVEENVYECHTSHVGVNIECIISIAFGGGQVSFQVTRGQAAKSV